MYEQWVLHMHKTFSIGVFFLKDAYLKRLRRVIVDSETLRGSVLALRIDFTHRQTKIRSFHSLFSNNLHKLVRKHALTRGDVTMKSEDSNSLGQSSESREIYAAQLALFGAMLSTLGDGISTAAAAIALNELENASNQNSQSQLKQSKQIEQMQIQIDHLTREMTKMNRIRR